SRARFVLPIVLSSSSRAAEAARTTLRLDGAAHHQIQQVHGVALNPKLAHDLHQGAREFRIRSTSGANLTFDSRLPQASFQMSNSKLH
ncbi:MAG: hypothetical protein K8F58_07960, partial [Bauldia sp.]|nr:hypothetical protein [Bauldia sp.]